MVCEGTLLAGINDPPSQWHTDAIGGDAGAMIGARTALGSQFCGICGT
jgi:hypothetical protein